MTSPIRTCRFIWRGDRANPGAVNIEFQLIFHDLRSHSVIGLMGRPNTKGGAIGKPGSKGAWVLVGVPPNSGGPVFGGTLWHRLV
jgi:hypothetical protein